jgi:phospholipase C
VVESAGFLSPPAIEAELPRPLTDRIEHVVVLMLENRSFDNLFGGLHPTLTAKGLFRGLLGNETNPLDPADPSAGSVSVFQGEPGPSTWIMPYPDPGELYTDMVQQIFGSSTSELPGVAKPPMSGFAWNYGQQPAARAGHGWPAAPPVPAHNMQYYSAASLPVSTHLGLQYAVCDAWFASGPVQTLANRVFTHCGTPTRVPGTNHSRVDNPDFTGDIELPFQPPVTDTTIFELLDDAFPLQRAPACSDFHDPSVTLNWKVYYHDAPLSALCKYVYERWCFDSLFGGNVFGFHEHIGDETNFENGSSLPPPIDVRDGERLLSQVVGILLKYPDTFDRTLLIVTYDEHGGLYDHVPPPPAVSPFTPPVSNFGYDRYGVRVPVLLINPSITPGAVYPPRQAHAPVPEPPLDHTSILSTLCAQFGLSGSLTPRVAQAPQLSGLIPTQPVRYPRPPLPDLAPAAAPAPVERRLGPAMRGLPSLAGALGLLGPMAEAARRKRGS